MVDESLGTKRTCPACNARFYDLGKDPIECPKCGETFTVEPILPSKHDQTAKPEEAVKPEVVEDEVDDEVIAAGNDEVAAGDVDEAAAVAEVDLDGVADVNVTPSDDEFLETDDDDAKVEDIIPVVKPDDEE